LECEINYGEYSSNKSWSNIPAIIMFDQKIYQTYPDSIYANYQKKIGTYNSNDAIIKKLMLQINPKQGVVILKFGTSTIL